MIGQQTYQLSLFPKTVKEPVFTAPETAADLNQYDHIIVMFSGGKDSLASLLRVIEMGADMSKIELWHHDIDGRGQTYMDWPVTPAYCQAIADFFNIPLYFSWRHGGFLREMCRKESPTAPTSFEVPTQDGITLLTRGGNGPLGTRCKFPQVGANLQTRWCSSSLKIDVADMAIRNQSRFKGTRTLVITGERAEESPNRAKYEEFEEHRTHLKKSRLVYHWRPVHHWKEQEVWDAIARWSINPHPAYILGFSRVSCAGCIFGNADQYLTFKYIFPELFQQMVSHEEEWGVTVKRDKSLTELIAAGSVYPATLANDPMIEIARSTRYTAPIQVENWTLPAGAFGTSCGPT